MGNFLLYSRRNCPYFYIGGELKKVNFTLQVSPEKINKEKAKKILTNLLRYDKIDILFQSALRGMCRLKFLFEV